MSEAATEPPPAPASGGRKRLSLATIATLVGLLVAGVTLFTFLEGRVKDPPAAAFDAEIASAALLPTRERLGAFLREQGQPTNDLPSDLARQEGLVFLVRVHLQGSLGETMQLRWRLYRDDGHAVRGRPYNQLLGKYTPENQDHARRAVFWVPYPPRPGRYYSRFTLLDGDAKPIDDFITSRFAIDRVPP